MLLVVLNGVALPAAPPARVIAGRVVAPVLPIVTRIAERVELDSFGAIVLEGRGMRCVLHLGSAFATCNDRVNTLGLAPFVAGGVTYIPLSAVVRAFGGDVRFDAASETVSLELGAERAIYSPAPFDANAPHVAPTAIVTPPPPAPLPTPGESPRPRRTAIPI